MRVLPHIVRLRATVAAIVCTVCALGADRAVQWIVDDDGPADFRAIQAAVDAVYVHSGDTILVRPGIYHGNVLIDSKDLVIRSEAGPFATFLDAQDSGSVVSLLNRTPATRIEGFTLTRGRDQTGGGVWIYGGGPVITRNIIQDNSAVGGFLGYGYGGGIEVYGSAATITRNVIRGNQALDGGGGIDVYYAGPSTAGTCCPLIAQNTIVDNTVTSPAGMGGGVLVFASEPRVSSSIISGNQAASGGGIYVERIQGNNDSPTAAKNVFYGNAVGDSGSNANWRLPNSNLQADPKLWYDEWIDLWPRSDSPALDAAESGLPPGPDLTGYSGAVDSDLDGVAEGDIGAVENRSDISGLAVIEDPAVAGAALLSWDDTLDPAVSFNVYRDDGNPFVTSGGACLAWGLTSPGYSDAAPLPAGSIRYYLVTGRGAVEGSRGMRSDGIVRPSTPACPGP